MTAFENLRRFVTAKPISCVKGTEAVSASTLLRVSWGGRRMLESTTADHCMGNCFNGQCKITDLRKKLQPIVNQNTR